MVFESVLLHVRDLCDPLWQMSRLSKNPDVVPAIEGIMTSMPSLRVKPEWYEYAFIYLTKTKLQVVDKDLPKYGISAF